MHNACERIDTLPPAQKKTPTQVNTHTDNIRMPTYSHKTSPTNTNKHQATLALEGAHAARHRTAGLSSVLRGESAGKAAMLVVGDEEAGAGEGVAAGLLAPRCARVCTCVYMNGIPETESCKRNTTQHNTTA